MVKESLHRQSVSASYMGGSTTRAFFIVIVRLRRPGHAASTLTFVDCAGSERIDKAMVTDAVLREAATINLSHRALRSIVDAISKQNAAGRRKVVHIPFRDSRLTFLLSPLFGRGLRTRAGLRPQSGPAPQVDWIAAVSPAACCAEESRATLQFAARVREADADAVPDVDKSGAEPRSLDVATPLSSAPTSVAAE